MSLLRRPVLVMFVFVVLFCLLASVWLNDQTEGLKRAQRANYVECQAIEAGHVQFNKVLDQLARNAQASTALTTAQKTQALRVYASIHLPILDCEGLRP